MIEKHIVNIGFPRCGTTWLWHHAKFEPFDDKENQILMTSLDFDQYVNYYKKFRVSANFQTNLWHVDREIINFIHQHATHISIIVRNPYDFVARYYDWIQTSQCQSELVQYIISAGYVRYSDIIARWRSDSLKFQIFFFEDIESDPEKFLNDYLKFCNLPVVKNNQIDYNKKKNPSIKPQRTLLTFTPQQVEYINQEIDKFQLLVDRDLTHWKK
jgi:hypothetical protein